MDRMLVVVFDSERQAEDGLLGLLQLHAEGALTVYASRVVVRSAEGVLSVRPSSAEAPLGTAAGLAVGSLIGLLGGPAGMAAGAIAGTLAGALRDYWHAGVALDFIEQATASLAPGKVALVAEIEEEWVIPADTRLQAAGGTVFRRTRADVADAALARDIAGFKAEVGGLEDEARQATSDGQTRLRTKVSAARASLNGAVQRARARLDHLEQESATKVHALEQQMALVPGEARSRLDERLKQVRSAGHERAAKLMQAWELTKAALAP